MTGETRRAEGYKRKRGGQPGNTNRLKSGRYARAFVEECLATRRLIGETRLFAELVKAKFALPAEAIDSALPAPSHRVSDGESAEVPLEEVPRGETEDSFTCPPSIASRHPPPNCDLTAAGEREGMDRDQGEGPPV